MNTPQTTPELLPCPFCGHVGLDFAEGETFRWMLPSCSGCGASCGDVRVQTMGEGTKEQWWEAAKLSAIKEWNTRAQVTAAPQEGVHPNAKTWPERIWLQGFPDFDEPQPYSAEQDAEATWCADRINSSDVEYIRADLRAPESPQPLAPPATGNVGATQIDAALSAKVACGETVRWHLEQAFPEDSATVREIMVREIVSVILASSAVGVEPLARKIFEHFQGYMSATFSWQGDDPDGYVLAKHAHDEKCIALIAKEIAAALPPPGGMVPLTLRQIAEATTKQAHVRSDDVIEIARAVEAAHGIKEGS